MYFEHLMFFPLLLQENHNGLLFTTAKELRDHLVRLFSGFAQRKGQGHRSLLATLQEGVAQESAHRWPDEWDNTVLPLLHDMLQ